MQHSQNFDEFFLFVSTDPHDNLNLGGEVVTYLGDEGYSITKSSSVWVPGGSAAQSSVLQESRCG